MSRVVVRTPPRPYAVSVGSGTASEALARALAPFAGRSTAVVTSARVRAAVGGRLRDVLDAKWSIDVHVPDGEAAKTWRQVLRLHEAFITGGLRRDGVVVAVGGGTVGDVVGFAAATYMRGVAWIGVPTTLLSMVDSSIGGKVGINHARAKNLVGAFHQPRSVVTDLDVLATLPNRELQSGAYEILKCALIGDRALFDRLATGGAPPRLWPEGLLVNAVRSAIRLKASVVSKDEREGGLRRVLNLGHTFGHALESATAYRRFTHGEAVGWGLIAATHLSKRRRLVTADEERRIRAAVDALGPRPSLAGISWTDVRKAMSADKKARGSRTVFVLPKGVGRVVVCDDIPERDIAAAWQHLRA